MEVIGIIPFPVYPLNNLFEKTNYDKCSHMFVYSYCKSVCYNMYI